MSKNRKIALLSSDSHSLHTQGVARIISAAEKIKVDILYQAPDQIEFHEYDAVISYFYPYILKREHLEACKRRPINVHIGYLPFGRGAHPNVHAIIDQMPAGVTAHFMDEGVDTGPIIARQEVPVYSTDTGEMLYNRLRQEAYRMILSLLTDIKLWIIFDKEIAGQDQSELEGVEHARTYKTKELARIRDLDSQLWDRNTFLEIVDVLRACTFTGYPGAYFTDDNGKRIFVTIRLEEEHEETDNCS